MVRTTHFDYRLPKSLIAQFPTIPRDHSKLLVVNRNTGKISHHFFYDLPDLLTTDDVLVFNKSRVFPARLIGKKKSSGKVEILLLKEVSPSVWEVITKPGFKLKDKIFFDGFYAEVTKRENYITEVKFSLPRKELLQKIYELGKTPLPPYIKSGTSEVKLRSQYQTVYAKDVGSAAAPTAGLHFSKSLLKKLKSKGVQTEFITLHVGLGTFAPIKEVFIENHKIHEEYFSVSQNTLQSLNKAKKEGKRIITVGTTTTRVLETCAQADYRNPTSHILHPTSSYTNLFIYPPYKFKYVDALITNFHLPKSTLLALVSAFTSYPNSKEKFKDFKSGLMGTAYKEAIKKSYRFFSFGDACFII